LVTLAYIAEGELDEAQKIIDYYMYTPGIWRLGGIIEAFVAATPIEGYDWSVRTGANVWLGIAAGHLYFHTNDERYLKFAERIAELPLSLQNQDRNSPNFGGVTLGPPGGPNVAGDQHIGYDSRLPAFSEIYATEISIDAYVLFKLLHKATGSKKYIHAADKCLHWLKKNGLNRTEHRFNRGYRDDIVATDIQSWGVSALGVELLDSFEKGLAENMVRFVEKNCLSLVEYKTPDKGKIMVRGVDFIDKQRAADLGRKPLVTFEWSFQFINAYRRLENDFRQRGEDDKVHLYQEKRKCLLESLLAAASEQKEGLVYPYATESDAVVGHEYNTPAEGNFSAISAAHAILALKGFDPLVLRSD